MAKKLSEIIEGVLGKLEAGEAIGGVVDERAYESRADDLLDLEPDMQALVSREIDAVIGMCESPIEQAALYQLAGFNWDTDGRVERARVVRLAGLIDRTLARVHIVPQVQIGRYRVDFLVDAGDRGRFAVECDGADFHKDASKDAARDREIAKSGIRVFRIAGKDIWRSAKAARAVAAQIREAL